MRQEAGQSKVFYRNPTLLPQLDVRRETACHAGQAGEREVTAGVVELTTPLSANCALLAVSLCTMARQLETFILGGQVMKVTIEQRKKSRSCSNTRTRNTMAILVSILPR